MSRADLEHYLRDHSCILHHHGGKHDVWLNTTNMQRASVPRHREIKRGKGSRYLP
ncbi:MAG: addiction module toxin, HicA family [Pirellulaceae bacterium]|nr:addiction module toxin, HicA family [Pirellulaceae bacterium]